MVSVGALWFPILVSAAVVFVASSVIHMFLPWHKGDFRQLPSEEAFRDAVRGVGDIPPGDYITPYAAGMKEAGTAEFRAKYEQGPVAILTVLPNRFPSMGPRFGQWFLYCAVVGIFTAYLTGVALGPGADYRAVFRIAGTAAFMGYGLAMAQGSIWLSRRWGTTLRGMADALVYGLLTGGVFGSMWPV
ncbi:MAG: hypothetical protein RQ751_09990 [Longimicrobiales bacterium]|nr:hypothetical protein [Longimicrobiales bacterium]